MNEGGKGLTYNPRDGILIIGICSRTKNTNLGEPGYQPGCGIARFLSEGKAELLKLKRFEMKHSLKDILWGKKRFVSELAMNQHLVDGPDFAGEEVERYLPALQRYQGKFYVQGLGGAPEAEKALYSSGHHFLILSGLYGMVSPDEPVQLYTCPVEVESIEVQAFWRRFDTLTRILLDYLQKNSITRVFDCTGRQIYRDMINWHYLKEKSGVTILHCHYAEAAGDPALGDLGRMTREYLLAHSEQELLDLQPDIPIQGPGGEFIFSNNSCPPPNYAHELPPGMPTGDQSEEDIRKIREYINYQLDEFELNLVSFLKDIHAKHTDLMYALDLEHRTKAEVRRKEYLREHPMEQDRDLSLIDFLEYGEYQRLIDGRWSLFNKTFGKKERFFERFEQLRKLRNKIKHNNPVSLSDLKEGEGHLLFFNSIFHTCRGTHT